MFFLELCTNDQCGTEAQFKCTGFKDEYECICGPGYYDDDGTCKCKCKSRFNVVLIFSKRHKKNKRKTRALTRKKGCKKYGLFCRMEDVKLMV